MADQIPHDHLYPPGHGSLRGFLLWLGTWRTVPLASPSLEGAERFLRVALKKRFIKKIDTLVGMAIGLTAWGERHVGVPGLAVSQASVAFLSQRALLHLAAHRLRQEEPSLAVTDFLRRGILVVIGGREARLGFQTGDIRVGLVGSKGADLHLPLPKQFPVSPMDLTDREWYAVHTLLLPPPHQPIRSPYWTRTLMDALLAVRSGQNGRVREAGGESLLYAAYWLARKPLPWAKIARHLGEKGSLLRKEADHAGMAPPR